MEQLLETLFKILFEVPEGVTIAPMSALAVAAIGAGINVLGGLFGASKARRQARAMQKQADDYDRQLRGLEASRQTVINPYEGVKDLSNMITNPFANLQVATKAAEMQGEQTDQALATTLDTLRATGAGAGGATALAQAAARAKQGVAATIEQQEAQNSRLRAQGEAQMQARLMAEQQRLQQADVAGRQFMFGVRENRETAKLDRLSALASQYRGFQFQAQTAQAGALGSALGTLGAGIIGSAGDIGT